MLVAEVHSRLDRILGPTEAKAITADVLQEIGRATLSNADDVMLFANALVARGGLHGAVGSSLRVKAILAGATPD